MTSKLLSAALLAMLLTGCNATTTPSDTMAPTSGTMGQDPYLGAPSSPTLSAPTASGPA